MKLLGCKQESRRIPAGDKLQRNNSFACKSYRDNQVYKARIAERWDAIDCESDSLERSDAAKVWRTTPKATPAQQNPQEKLYRAAQGSELDTLEQVRQTFDWRLACFQSAWQK